MSNLWKFVCAIILATVTLTATAADRQTLVYKNGVVLQNQWFEVLYEAPSFYQDGYVYTVEINNSYGDPDIYLHEKVNGVWYKLKESVNASGSVEYLTFTKADFSSNATEIDIDVKGYTDAGFNIAVYKQSTQFLNFPISGYAPYSPNRIISAMDHRVDTVYSHDGEIFSFTGERFTATVAYPESGDSACYPKSSGSWSSLLLSAYQGTSGVGSKACGDGQALNYDDHPGFDYAYGSYNTSVKAASSGIVVSTGNGSCIIKNVTGSCADWGAIGIDHGNGYVTQYWHMTSITVSAGATVSAGETIGYVSNVSPPTKPVGTHLHFEALKRKDQHPANYDGVNYVAADPYGFDTSKGVEDYIIRYDAYTPSRCLWIGGCQY